MILFTGIDSLSDLGFVTLGLRESGCKLVLSPPTVGKKMQICTLIHANLESQIQSLLMTDTASATAMATAAAPKLVAKVRIILAPKRSEPRPDSQFPDTDCAVHTG